MTSPAAVRRRRQVLLALLSWGVGALFLLAALGGRGHGPAVRTLWACLALVWVVVGVNALRKQGAVAPDEARAADDPAPASAPAAPEQATPGVAPQDEPVHPRSAAVLDVVRGATESPGPAAAPAVGEQTPPAGPPTGSAPPTA